MDFETAVKDQIALLNQGDPLEAFDRYFGDSGVMFDNDEPFADGKAECRSRQESFITGATNIIGNITHCSVDTDESVCVFRNQSTFVDGKGKQTQIDGVHWQRWTDGKIVEERYYRGEMMAEKIAGGILEQGDRAFDDLGPRASAEATALRGAVLAAVEGLVQTEQVEIATGATALVIEELVHAGIEANHPRHALKKLRIALIRSEHVEEVYASDLALESAFRRAMGG